MARNRIYFFVLLFGLLFPLILYGQADSFVTQQKKYKRVRTAFKEKDAAARQLFRQAGIAYPPQKIFLRIFKAEKVIELWAWHSAGETFKLVTSYPFCTSSGTLGPKRMQGDLQIPEGFYHIEQFNPLSDYYLSLGLNYPNASDRILGVKGKLGGDIFIHGDCVTIGCIPITNEKIKELYVIAVQARGNGQKRIPVHIFPARLNKHNFNQLKKTFNSEIRVIKFWENIKTGFDWFEKRHLLPQVLVDKQTGGYIFK